MSRPQDSRPCKWLWISMGSGGEPGEPCRSWTHLDTWKASGDISVSLLLAWSFLRSTKQWFFFKGHHFTAMASHGQPWPTGQPYCGEAEDFVVRCSRDVAIGSELSSGIKGPGTWVWIKDQRSKCWTYLKSRNPSFWCFWTRAQLWVKSDRCWWCCPCKSQNVQRFCLSNQ